MGSFSVGKLQLDSHGSRMQPENSSKVRFSGTPLLFSNPFFDASLGHSTGTIVSYSAAFSPSRGKRCWRNFRYSHAAAHPHSPPTKAPAMTSLG